MQARFIYSDGVLEKLGTKHGVTKEEVRQCFLNLEGGTLEDNREEHRTDPPTQWFIAETDKGKKLKVCFIMTKTERGHEIEIKSAFPPDSTEIAIYDRHAKG